MTQTVQKPVQLTLTTMLAKFEEGFPSLVEPFEQIKPDLEKGTGAQVLANLIGCEVEVRAEQGLTVYSWAGKTDTFELSVPKPFEPRPQRSSETQRQAQVQEKTPGASQTPVLQAEDAPLQLGPAELPEAPGTAPGLFTALLGLLGDSTLLMTVARTGEASNEPALTITVVPQGEEAFTPVCLTGSVSELDTHFVAALIIKAASRESFAEQVEALKIADQALEEAKKQEVAAKNKQTEAKKKSVQKKEEAKAEEKKVEEKREAEKPQEKLF